MGYFLTGGPLSFAFVFPTFGILLVAACSGALNQLQERHLFLFRRKTGAGKFIRSEPACSDRRSPRRIAVPGDRRVDRVGDSRGGKINNGGGRRIGRMPLVA